MRVMLVQLHLTQIRGRKLEERVRGHCEALRLSRKHVVSMMIM